ncbi:hypothetical protein SRHO_G00172720 [Serrasalmus rhombeus]
MSPFIHSLVIGSEMPDLDFTTKHRQQPAQQISSPGDYHLSLSQLTPPGCRLLVLGDLSGMLVRIPSPIIKGSFSSAAEQQEDDGHMVSKRSPIMRLFLAVGTLLSSRSAGQNEGKKGPRTGRHTHF